MCRVRLHVVVGPRQDRVWVTEAVSTKTILLTRSEPLESTLSRLSVACARNVKNCSTIFRGVWICRLNAAANQDRATVLHGDQQTIAT